MSTPATRHEGPVTAADMPAQGPRLFDSAEQLRALVGEELGTTRWVEITQERIDLFARATGDYQWIHTDPERASRESPYGGTIAHGYLTLGLTPALIAEVMGFRNLRMGVNYGLNKVRFNGPVPVGSRIRARVSLVGVRQIAEAVRVVTQIRIEREGVAKPCCVAESVSLYYL